MASLLSAPTALRGSTLPRVWTPPLHDLEDPRWTRGYEAIRFAEVVLHIRLYPWQRWLLVHLLELNADGTFRFRTAVVLVGRQNGKTSLLLVLFLWRLYVDGARLVIGTAQNLDIAEETWMAAVDMAEANEELWQEVAHVDKTNGKKTLRLVGGERYKVAAATRRGGRSLSGDFIGLDELREHQNWDSWAAVTKTTMARPRAQILGLSNAGDRKSVVLKFLREKALAALAAEDERDPSLGLFEWSAPEGCALDDPEGWALSNPSLGMVEEGWEFSLTPRAISTAMETDPEEVFRTEVLCQWVDGILDPVVPPDVWALHSVPGAPLGGGRPAFAVNVSPVTRRTAVAVAAMGAAGRPHIELTAEMLDGEPVLDYRPGTEWVGERMAQLCARHHTKQVYLFGTAAQALEATLAGLGLDPHIVPFADMTKACGHFYDLATADPGHGLTHGGQSELDRALAGAQRRETEAGGWVWSRRLSAGDITPLFAATAALWALHNGKVRAAPDIF